MHTLIILTLTLAHCTIMPTREVWETYANELKSHGYGHPLWYPEPSEDGEIQIGDVGYIEKGHFKRCFNVMVDVRDPCNRLGVPEDP